MHITILQNSTVRSCICHALYLYCTLIATYLSNTNYLNLMYIPDEKNEQKEDEHDKSESGNVSI